MVHSTSTKLSSPVLFAIIDLDLNDLESVLLSSSLSQQYYHKFPDVFE